MTFKFSKHKKVSLPLLVTGTMCLLILVKQQSIFQTAALLFPSKLVLMYGESSVGLNDKSSHTVSEKLTREKEGHTKEKITTATISGSRNDATDLMKSTTSKSKEWTPSSTSSMALATLSLNNTHAVPALLGHNTPIVFTIRPYWVQLNTHDMFLYSAYYDDVGKTAFVRVLVSGVCSNRSVVCYYFDKGEYSTFAAKVQGHCQQYVNASRRSRGLFIMCPLASPDQRPFAVAVSIENGALTQDRPVQPLPVSIKQIAYSDEMAVSSTSENKAYNAHNLKASGQHSQGKQASSRQSSMTKNSRTTTLKNTKNAVPKWNNTKGHGKPKWNIIKCVPAFHSFDNVMGLIQQVEISRLFGVEHFVFYMFSAGTDVRKLLQYYVSQGVADVYNWTLPLATSNYHYFDQVNCIQECLFRHLRASRYILFGDVDEIFAPRSAGHLLPILDGHISRNPHCGALLFRNTFFNAQYGKYAADTNQSYFHNHTYAEHHGLNMLLVDKRSSEIWIPGQRSKMAVIPTRVRACNIHKIIRLRGHYAQCDLAPTEGLLHHYRNLPSGLKPMHLPNRTGGERDPYMLRFAADIVRRVDKVLQDLERVQIKTPFVY